jgi:hypothetical protein
MVIAVDFDGTCVTHEFPDVGKDVGAVPVLKRLVSDGHRLIIFTMRCDHTSPPNPKDPEISPISGNYLTAAVNWFKENGIELWGIQYNPNQKDWTESNKCYAQIYIDDAALGAPLIHGAHERPFIDWKKVEEYFYPII